MASHERHLPRLVRPSSLLFDKSLLLHSRHQLVPQPSAEETPQPAADPTPSISQAAVSSPPTTTSTTAQGSALPGGFPGAGREDEEMPGLEDLD